MSHSSSSQQPNLFGGLSRHVINASASTPQTGKPGGGGGPPHGTGHSRATGSNGSNFGKAPQSQGQGPPGSHPPHQFVPSKHSS